MADPRLTLDSRSGADADCSSSSYLAALRRELPAAYVDELADGLTETIDRLCAEGLSESDAVRVAIAEFGDVRQVARAFVDGGVPRRTARRLLMTGPLVGTCWAAVLILGRAWSWPVPGFVRLTVGAVWPCPWPPSRSASVSAVSDARRPPPRPAASGSWPWTSRCSARWSC